MKFDVIIPFCSEDAKYIQHSINGIKKLANKIIITYWTKMFDGTNENFEIINDLKNKNSDCVFIEIPFEYNSNTWWYYGHSRYIGMQQSSTSSDCVLLLDSDEVFEEDKLKNWINSNIEFDASYFANYWYFRDEKYQSKTYENSPVMINKKIIKPEYFYTNIDRTIYSTMSNFKILKMVLGNDGLPMCHHYSWVLSKEKMLKKVMRSAHKNDMNWNELIEKEFSSNFSGVDFIHGYEFNILNKSYL